MRARVVFTTSATKEDLVALLSERSWLSSFEHESGEANGLLDEIRESMPESEERVFSKRGAILLSHAASGSRGTLTLERGNWVVRMVNPDAAMLRLACEAFVSDLTQWGKRNRRGVEVIGPALVFERGRSATLLEGRVSQPAGYLRLISVVTAGVSVSAVLASLMSTAPVHLGWDRTRSANFAMSLDSLTRRVARQEQVSRELTNAVAANGRPIADIALGRQLEPLRSEVALIDARLSALEAAIKEDPSKALAVPLLQRDLDNLASAHKAEIESLGAAIDRVYDLNKWFMGGLAVSLLSLALSNLVQGRPPSIRRGSHGTLGTG